MYSAFSMALLLVMVMLAVSFYTILERKCLSYLQIRKGPNKVVYMGLAQAASDGVKLLTKMSKSPSVANKMFYVLSPAAMLVLALVCWVFLPNMAPKGLSNPLLVILCLLGFNVYCFIFSGWCSNSNYGMVGSVRAVAQSISYEVCFIFFVISPAFYMAAFLFQGSTFMTAAAWFMLAAWVAVCTAEVNRAPFDFSEGESELVSGYNIEYGSSSFTLLFLAEYGFILFLAGATTSLFLPHSGYLIWGGILSLSFIYLRGCLPRFRYDSLMYVCWKSILPVSIAGLFLFYLTACL